MKKMRLRSVEAPTSEVSAQAQVEDKIVAWQQLADHLCPLIGHGGFCALYARAQRLALPAEQRLALDADADLRSAGGLLALLRGHLLAQHASAAIVANAAVTDTFSKLLAGLIGQGLTTRLQNKAWAERPEGTSK